MKLLFDQNISYRIVKKLSDAFPLGLHVSKVGLASPAKDSSIWQYARSNSYAIVTFDEDFVDLAGLYGSPPKVVWLRLGNVSTSAVAQKLIDNRKNIESFLAGEKEDILEIYGCLTIFVESVRNGKHPPSEIFKVRHTKSSSSYAPDEVV
jgi:predicted nuclease of predicted toxin-antitoxin system